MKEPKYTHEIRAKRPIQLMSHDMATLRRDEFIYVGGITEEDEKQKALGAIKIFPLKFKNGTYTRDDGVVAKVPEDLGKTEDVEVMKSTSEKAKASGKSRGKKDKKGKRKN